MRYAFPISIVMPCYNYGKYVSKASESILNQSFQHFELIIINDGSTDNSHEEIIKHKDNRISYFKFRNNKGNYPARNFGFKKAKGKYICVMNADDIALTNSLEVQYNYLELHPRLGALGSQGEWMNENGTPTGKIVAPRTLPHARLKPFSLINNFTLHPSLMFRSSFLKKHNLLYNEKYRYASDFDLISRCIFLFPVQNIKNVLVMYRKHGAQISSQSNKEQVRYADLIRLSQLKNFKIILSDYERKIYLQLIKFESLQSINELEDGMAPFNKLLFKKPFI